MRVEVELLDHPKFIRLERRLGPEALKVLIRLWGHCQTSQRGEKWTGADAEYVEVVARWTGAPNACYDALVACGFVDVARNAVVIHDWNAFNSRAVTNWKIGAKGGRPPKNPRETLGLSKSEPKGNPRVIVGLTQGPPDGKPFSAESKTPLSEMSEVSEMSEGVSARARATHPPSVEASEAEWPTRAEWDAVCDIAGVPAHVTESEWHRQEAKPPNDRWRGIARSRLRHHAARVLGWWQEKGCPGPAPIPAPGAASAAGKESVWNVKKRVEALDEELENHKGNPEGTWPPAVREEWRSEFEKLLEERNRLSRSLSGGTAVPA